MAPYKRIVGWTLFTSKEGICKELAFLVGCGQLQPNDVENVVSVYLWRLGTTQRTTPNAQCRYSMCDRPLLLLYRGLCCENGPVAWSMGKASLHVQYRTSVRWKLLKRQVFGFTHNMYAYRCTRTYVRVHLALFGQTMSIKRTSSTKINKQFTFHFTYLSSHDFPRLRRIFKNLIDIMFIDNKYIKMTPHSSFVCVWSHEFLLQVLL